MSDSNWMGILGGFWLAKNILDEDSSKSSSSSTMNDYSSGGFVEGVPYIPESEEFRARNFVHRYATDGENIFTQDQFCLFIHRLGVVYFVGQDEDGRNIYDIHPCKKSQLRDILTYGVFWDEPLTVGSRNKVVDEVIYSLARRGYPINTSRFRFLYKFDLMEKVFPDTFRYLSAEESYYHWRSLGN